MGKTRVCERYPLRSEGCLNPFADYIPHLPRIHTAHERLGGIHILFRSAGRTVSDTKLREPFRTVRIMDEFHFGRRLPLIRGAIMGCSGPSFHCERQHVQTVAHRTGIHSPAHDDSLLALEAGDKVEKQDNGGIGCSGIRRKGSKKG